MSNWSAMAGGGRAVNTPCGCQRRPYALGTQLCFARCQLLADRHRQEAGWNYCIEWMSGPVLGRPDTVRAKQARGPTKPTSWIPPAACVCRPTA